MYDTKCGTSGALDKDPHDDLVMFMVMDDKNSVHDFVELVKNKKYMIDNRTLKKKPGTKYHEDGRKNKAFAYCVMVRFHAKKLTENDATEIFNFCDEHYAYCYVDYYRFQDSQNNQDELEFSSNLFVSMFPQIYYKYGNRRIIMTPDKPIPKEEDLPVHSTSSAITYGLAYHTVEWFVASRTPQ